jgi:hypothetical protein
MENCAQCKQPLTDNKITFQGKKLHAHHFTCPGCKQVISSSNCKEFEGRLYCLKDYEVAKSLKTVCFGCKKVNPYQLCYAMYMPT